MAARSAVRSFPPFKGSLGCLHPTDICVSVHSPGKGDSLGSCDTCLLSGTASSSHIQCCVSLQHHHSVVVIPPFIRSWYVFIGIRANFYIFDIWHERFQTNLHSVAFCHLQTSNKPRSDVWATWHYRENPGCLEPFSLAEDSQGFLGQKQLRCPRRQSQLWLSDLVPLLRVSSWWFSSYRISAYPYLLFSRTYYVTS